MRLGTTSNHILNFIRDQGTGSIHIGKDDSMSSSHRYLCGIRSISGSSVVAAEDFFKNTLPENHFQVVMDRGAYHDFYFSAAFKRGVCGNCAKVFFGPNLDHDLEGRGGKEILTQLREKLRYEWLKTQKPAVITRIEGGETSTILRVVVEANMDLDRTCVDDIRDVVKRAAEALAEHSETRPTIYLTSEKPLDVEIVL
jgi:hypothetical protein